MTDLVTVASQISTPIKVGWLLWLVWLVVQIGTYRWSRQVATARHHDDAVEPRPHAQVSEPTPDPILAQAEEPQPESAARRRRRRRSRPHDEGAGHQVGAFASAK